MDCDVASDWPAPIDKNSERKRFNNWQKSIDQVSFVAPADNLDKRTHFNLADFSPFQPLFVTVIIIIIIIWKKYFFGFLFRIDQGK